jgi:hypothetical protein
VSEANSPILIVSAVGAPDLLQAVKVNAASNAAAARMGARKFFIKMWNWVSVLKTVVSLASRGRDSSLCADKQNSNKEFKQLFDKLARLK